MNEGNGDKDAAEEIYILCTNFLLYVALVLIIVLVTKLYLETSSHHGNNKAVMDMLKEYDQEKDENNVEFDELSTEMKLQRSSSLVDFTSWSDTGNLSKSEVFRRLCLSFFGLNISFIFWGLLQERMLTIPYGDGEYFTYSYGLVFTNRLGGLVLSACLMYGIRPHISRREMIYEYAFPSISNMLSSWCQYEALKYVTFPTQMLSKCFKLVPIMIMGRILGGIEYPLYDYVVAGLIGLGISLFLTATENFDFGTDSTGESETAGEIHAGLLLLAFYLGFDSFTSQWQSRMFMKNEELSPFQMMFIINLFSTVFSLITLIHTGELAPTFSFVVQHPEIHLHFIAFSICSTIGQIFIFYTIKQFGAVVFAIIMSVRILLSILISVFIYDHPLDSLGYLGLIIVFGAIGYRIQQKTKGKHLIKYEGMDDTQGPELFREWHEHLDL